MDVKTCTRCEETLPVSEFGVKATNQLQSACKPCQRLISSEWYVNNKQRQKQNAVRNKQRTIAKFMVWKQTLRCVLCGENRTPCLDFHHVDSDEKEVEISYASGSLSRKTLISELKKCICTCSNCHRLIHSGDLKLPTDINRIKIIESDLM